MNCKTCWILISLTLAFVGCKPAEPYSYVKVSGKISYDDGTLIPASRIVLTFVPVDNQGKPTATQPRPGIAEVNVKTGEFDCVTSHNYGDGVVPGKHKVVSRNLGDIVPPEYGSLDQTPLIIDARDAPFTFKIPKPKR